MVVQVHLTAVLWNSSAAGSSGGLYIVVGRDVHERDRRVAIKFCDEEQQEGRGQFASMCNTTMANMAAEASVIPATLSVASGA